MILKKKNVINILAQQSSFFECYTANPAREKDLPLTKEDR